MTAQPETGGQMTDLPAFTSTVFDGTELFEVVAPGTAIAGVNYGLTSVQLASLLETLKNTPVLFADLPAVPVVGMQRVVSDSNTATWGATIAGSGGNQVLAWYNGTNWTVVGI